MNNSIPLPPGYHWQLTDDGTQTFMSPLYGENGHSTAGATQETLHHYINGCGLLERIEHHKPFQLLEVGFGSGLGLITTLKSIVSCQSSLHYLGLEIDENLVSLILKHHPEQDFFKDFKRIQINEDIVFYEKILYPHVLRILIGDARKRLEKYLKLYPATFHAIYQDAFSPKKNPSLWTVEWFQLLKKYSHQDCILSTYSSSASIRKSLHHAKWAVEKGPGFGPKKHSTRATSQGATSINIISQIQSTSVPLLQDSDLKKEIT